MEPLHSFLYPTDTRYHSGLEILLSLLLNSPFSFLAALLAMWPLVLKRSLLVVGTASLLALAPLPFVTTSDVEVFVVAFFCSIWAAIYVLYWTRPPDSQESVRAGIRAGVVAFVTVAILTITAAIAFVAPVLAIVSALVVAVAAHKMIRMSANLRVPKNTFD